MGRGVKDTLADARHQEQLVADTKILQKVNAAHREAWITRYPGQVDHCLRLVMERLHTGLEKCEGVDIRQPTTWHLTTQEILDLAQAAGHLHAIKQQLA